MFSYLRTFDKLSGVEPVASLCHRSLTQLVASDGQASISRHADAAVAKYVLSVNSKGNVRTTTMRAFDEPEHFEFLRNLS